MADDAPNDQNSAAVTSEDDPAVPDYLASPDAVLRDEDTKWRYGRPPDYSKTRKVWAETKQKNHAAGSLPQLVENLVKNWEIEASFKPRLQDWRTIDHANYSFAMNGGYPQPAEHMLKVGTYNAILCPNEYYSPEHSDFAASHKTFKGMMPTFAWEVIEVYSGPPTVAFKWRHWGEMKNDYVAFNDKGEKVTAKAHGGPIEIFGVTVADVGENVRLQAIDTWMDPSALFRQIAPNGVVNKVTVDNKVKKPIVGENIYELDVAGSGSGTNHAANKNARIEIPKEDAAHPTTDHISHDRGLVVQSSDSNGSIDHQMANDTAPQGYAGHPFETEEQDSENMPPPEENLMSRSESLAAQFHAPKPEYGAENVFADVKEDQQTDQVTQIESTSSGAKRAKLGDSEPEFLGSTSNMLLDMGSLSAHQHLQIPPPTQPIESAGAVGDDTHTTVGVETVHNTLVPGTMDPFNPHPGDFLREGSEHAVNVVETVMPDVGEAVAAPADSEETHHTYRDMSNITPEEVETLMNQE